MNYIEITINGETYKLRLTTRSLVALEKSLGCNPIQIFYDIDNNKLPKLTDMGIILQSMLQAYHHGISVEKTYDLLDAYFADGHNMFDLVPVFVDVFTACGFINASVEAEEVNPN